jgi:prophage maintenance system killer protein
MHSVLRDEGLVIIADQEGLYQFVVAIASGQKSFEEIVDWLKANTKPR